MTELRLGVTMSSDPLAAQLPITPTARPTTPPSQIGPVGNNFDTPISRKATGTLPCSSTHYVREYQMRQNGIEMSGKVVGPMPLKDFLEEFLPPADDPCLTGPEIEKFDPVYKCTKEVDMYEPLIGALQSFCPSLCLVDTHARPDKNPGTHDYKPDISAYARDPKPDATAIVNTNFSLMDFHIEVKYNNSDDPFIDDPKSDSPESRRFEHWAEQSQDTLGQITSYALTQLGSQFRTFIFTLLLFQRHARIIRWDRAGAVVTELFPLPKVASFLRRYDKAPPDARGFDTSVTTTLPSDIDVSRARKVLQVDSDIPLFQFSLPRGNEEVHFIGAQPVFEGNGSATGRSTRAFPVFDPETGNICFLKDTWRIDLPDMTQEGHIYERLDNAGVPHIAPFKMAADIPNHRTLTQGFVSKDWALPIPRGLRPHQHYRLVLGVVGRPLSSMISTWELVRAIRDAIRGRSMRNSMKHPIKTTAVAHKHAYETAKILHRDISVGNILIVEDGGLLIDWDLCKPLSDPAATSARQTERTGTWQFIAARLLQDPSLQVHTLADDLESFLHVLVWMALRYTDHEMQPNHLTNLMQGYFDECYPQDHNEGFGGGDQKASYIASKHIANNPKFKNPKLSSLLSSLCETFAVRYQSAPSAREVKAYGGLLKLFTERQELHQFLQEHPVHRHKLSIKNLETSEWMLETFTKAIQDQGWPVDDKPVKHILVRVEPGKKRKSGVSVDFLAPPVGKRRRATAVAVVDEEGRDDKDEELGTELGGDQDEEPNAELDGDELEHEELQHAVRQRRKRGARPGGPRRRQGEVLSVTTAG